MKYLSGVVKPAELEVVETATKLRFENADAILAPECLILYEQGILPFEEVTELYSKETGVNVQTPRVDTVHPSIREHFIGKDCVPIKYDNVEEKIYVGVLPDRINTYIEPYKNKDIVYVPVPIHWYVENYTQIYSRPSFILSIPVKQLFDFIVKEAIQHGAADITISSKSKRADIYYNVRKKRVASKRYLLKSEIDPLIQYVAANSGATISSSFKHSLSFTTNLDANHVGRCEVTKTIHGLCLTIRVLPLALFTMTLQDLNLSARAEKFIRDYVMLPEKGLRIFVGPTFSGKNTTIASILNEVLGNYTLKGVSVEQPVELRMDFLEQVNTETEEEYRDGVKALLRQNPDVVYVTEMTDTTATSILNVANTGKVVFTSLHANTLADVVTRIQDLTGKSADRVVQNIQTLIYQELVRDEEKDKLYPVNRCIYFSEELRFKLFGKTTGEIVKILTEQEKQWID